MRQLSSEDRKVIAPDKCYFYTDLSSCGVGVGVWAYVTKSRIFAKSK